MKDPREAGPPFQYTPRADVVLRSSDNVDFYVMRGFLAFCSPVLEGKLSLPPSYSEVSEKGNTGAKLTLVTMEEDSTVLKLLLYLCYPGTPPDIQTLDEIPSVMAAAQKYSMEIVGEELRKKLCISKLMKEDPLSVFCVAFHYGWEDVGRKAAKNTLTMGILPFCKQLEYLTGVELFQLEEYRRTCGKAAVSWLENHSHHSIGTNFVWHTFGATHSVDCRTSANDKNKWFKNMIANRPLAEKSWWKIYYEDLLIRLEKCPGGTTVLDEQASNTALERAKSCTLCSGPQGHQDMANYKALVAEAVEQVVSEIVLDVKFEGMG